MKLRSITSCAIALVVPAFAQAATAKASPLWSGSTYFVPPFHVTSYCSGNLSMVADPEGSGNHVIQMTVPDTCAPYTGSKPRADLQTIPRTDTNCPCGGWGNPGDSYYFMDEVRFNSTIVPPVTGNGTAFLQFDEIYGYPYGGSPVTPASDILYSGGANRFVMAFGRASSSNYQFIGPPLDTRWHTFTYYVRFSPNSSSNMTSSQCNTSETQTGFTQAWFDGQPVQLAGGGTGVLSTDHYTYCYQNLVTGNNWNGGGSNSPGNFLDVNSYRASSSSTFNVPSLSLDHATAKIGASLADVEPDITPGS